MAERICTRLEAAKLVALPSMLIGMLTLYLGVGHYTALLILFVLMVAIVPLANLVHMLLQPLIDGLGFLITNSILLLAFVFVICPARLFVAPKATMESRRGQKTHLERPF